MAQCKKKYGKPIGIIVHYLSWSGIELVWNSKKGCNEIKKGCNEIKK